jgi:hypothetical protein
MPPTLDEMRAESRLSWQQLAIFGTIMVGLWAVFALPPLFSSPHVLTLCNRANCESLPTSEFIAGELAISAVFLGIAAWVYTLAIQRK